MSAAGEFDFIARRLAPLSRGAPGAAGLADDGALIDLDPGETLAVTADTLIEGRHFPADGDPALAARKALRANLSDLAAMGAQPFGYLLNIIWPEAGVQSRADAMVAGLQADQDRFGIRLLGGDTTRGPGPWSLAVTMFGRRPAGVSLRRGGARAGDALVVAGVIGDAGLGLKSLQGGVLGLDSEACAMLERRSLLPEPCLGALPAMRRHAHAAIDVSDGLLADARHLAQTSKLALMIDLERVPHSMAALRWIAAQPDEAAARLELAAAGDDYALLMATPEPSILISELAAAGLAGAVAGRFDAGSGVDVRFEGRGLSPEVWGFTHF